MRIILLAILLCTPYLVVAATSIVPCDGATAGILRKVCGPCELVQLGNNIIAFLIKILAFGGAVMFAYGGMLMAMSAGDMGKVEKGKGIMTNVVIGLVILLSGWLIVDTVMKVLVGKDNESKIGPWNKIQCVAQPVPVGGTAVAQSTQSSGTVTSSTPPPYTGPLSQCAVGNTACNVSALQSVGFSQAQANVMSCIAMTESSGNPTARTTVPGSTACGTFQITRTTWTSAARGSCGDFSNCTNATCNMQVAQSLVQRSGYRDWTCKDCNAKAQACINKYSGS